MGHPAGSYSIILSVLPVEAGRGHLLILWRLLQPAYPQIAAAADVHTIPTLGDEQAMADRPTNPIDTPELLLPLGHPDSILAPQQIVWEPLIHPV